MKLAISRKVGEATLSGRGLVNLPAKAVRELGWQAGDKLSVTVEGENVIVLTRKPKNFADAYAGLFGDLFGDHDEILAYLDEKRRSWDPD